MKILIVGGNGFIGRAIFDKLSHDGHDVLKLDRNESAKNIPKTVFGDIFNPLSYFEFLKKWKPEVVIQCAWVTGQKIYRDSQENRIHQGSTIQFATDCINTGTRHFIGLGSCAEYGTTSAPCIAGNTATEPNDLYGKSKLETFMRIQAITDGTDTRFTWARIFQPYGRDQDAERLIPWALNMLSAGEEILVANPNTELDWISTRDIASAISWTLSSDLPVVIDIGTSIATSVLNLLTSLAKILNANTALVKVEPSSKLVQSKKSLVVSSSSPLLANGWRPDDLLSSGLRWAIKE